MQTIRRAWLALVVAMLLAVGTTAAGAQGRPAAAPTDSIALLLRFSALAELAGDDVARAVRAGVADTGQVRATVARLRAEARAHSAAGAHASAARTLDAAAALERYIAQRGSGDTAADLAARRAVAAILRAAADAYAAAGDTVRYARRLVEVAAQTFDGNALMPAFGSLGALPTRERVLVLLAFEQQLRWDDEHATADSLMLLACRSLCAEVTEHPDGLIEAVEHEMTSRRAARGPVMDAIRALLAERHLAGAPFGLPRELLVPRAADAAVDAAANELRSGGRPDLAAHLRLAEAYVRLPDVDFTGAAPAAGEALQAADAALTLYPSSRTAERATALSLAAVAQAQRARRDSASALLAEAERLAATAPARLRGYIRRRSALAAAMRRDSAAAVRLANEAAAIVGDTGVLAAVHRFRVARELAAAGSGGPALRLMQLAYPQLAGKFDRAYTADLAVTMAEAQRLAGNGDSAAIYFDRAAGLLIASGAHGAAAHVVAARAEDAVDRGRIAEARELLARATELARASEVDDPILRARLLNGEAMLRLAEGRVAEAVPIARAAASQVGPAWAEHFESLRIDAIAQAWRMVERYERATDLPRPTDADSAYRALTASSAGLVRGPSLERLVPARPRLRPFGEGALLTLAAALRVERGALSEAYRHLEHAAPLLEAARHPELAKLAHATRGRIFAQVGRADSAVVYLRLAAERAPAGLLRALQGGSAVDPLQTAGLRLREEVLGRVGAPDVRERLARALRHGRDAGNTLLEARALTATATYYLRRSRPLDPRRAAAYYDSALTVLHAIDQRDLTDWHRIQLSEQFGYAQGEAALAWLALAPSIGPRAAAAAAIAAADRGRGVAFSHALRQKGVADEALARLLDPAMRDRSMAVVGEALLRAPIGTYGVGVATLSYVHAGDTLLAFLSIPGDTAIAEIVVRRSVVTPDSLAALVTAFRAAIGADGASTRGLERLDSAAIAARNRGLGVGVSAAGSLAEASAAVADVLLPPELARVTGAVVIIPAGPVASVPFAALPAPGGALLGEGLSLRYALSLASQHAASGSRRIFRNVPAAERATWLADAVVLGNPTMPAVPDEGGGRIVLDQLPGAEAEARAVAALVGVQPILGGAAHYAAVRARADSATIVHLATHGYAYASEAKVGDSFVALAPTERDDGVVTVDELLGDPAFRLSRAELVVLSACQTGLGQTTSSEGTLGLQRAILASGAGGALVSLWSVSDEATSLLLQAFYRHWLQDPDRPSKAEALKRAQADVRGDERFVNPRYWAAFQLVGLDDDVARPSAGISW